MVDEYLIYGDDDGSDILSCSEYTYGDESTKITIDEEPPKTVISSFDAKENYPYISVPGYSKDDTLVSSPIYDIEYIKLLILKTFVGYDEKYSSMVQQKLDSIYPYVSSQVTASFSSYYQGILDNISSSASNAISVAKLYADDVGAATVSASNVYTDSTTSSIHEYISEVAASVYSSAVLSGSTYTDYIHNQINGIISSNDTDYRHNISALSDTCSALSASINETNRNTSIQVADALGTAVYSSYVYTNSAISASSIAMERYTDLSAAAAVSTSKSYTDSSSSEMMSYANSMSASLCQYIDTSANSLSASLVRYSLQQVNESASATLDSSHTYADASAMSAINISEEYAASAASIAQTEATAAANLYTNNSIDTLSGTVQRSVTTYAWSAYSAAVNYTDERVAFAGALASEETNQAYLSACSYADSSSLSAIHAAYLSAIGASANSVLVSEEYTDASVLELSRTIPDLVKSAYSGISDTIQDSKVVMTAQTGTLTGATLFELSEKIATKINNKVIIYSYTYYSMIDDTSDDDVEIIYVSKTRGNDWIVKKAVITDGLTSITYASSYGSQLSVDQAMGSPGSLNYMTIDELNI